VTQTLVVFWHLVMVLIQQELGFMTEFSHLAPCGQDCHVLQPGIAQQALWHREVLGVLGTLVRPKHCACSRLVGKEKLHGESGVSSPRKKPHQRTVSLCPHGSSVRKEEEERERVK